MPPDTTEKQEQNIKTLDTHTTANCTSLCYCTQFSKYSYLDQTWSSTDCITLSCSKLALIYYESWLASVASSTIPVRSYTHKIQ